ncbi:MAG: hypothetical protein R3D78_02660 [Paracoccaceae bacterium]|jgi:hypothetical protein
MAQSTFHAASGGLDFVGLRRGRRGEMEIIYDDGVRRRLVWRVLGGASEGQIGEALQRAARATRVLPAIYSELRKRAISIEAVA